MELSPFQPGWASQVVSQGLTVPRALCGAGGGRARTLSSSAMGADGDPWHDFKKGWERYPSPTLAQGPGPAWKNPRLMLGSAGVPLGLGLGGETLAWTKSKGKNMLGPIPKTGCDVEGTADLPIPSLHLLLAKAAPCPLPPGHGGSAHTSSPLEWALPWMHGHCRVRPPAQPGKILIRPDPSARGEWKVAEVVGWAGGGGGHGAHGHPVLSPVPDITGPDTGDSTISGAHPSSQTAPSSLGGGVAVVAQSWRHVALFLAKCEVWGWAQSLSCPGPRSVSVPDTSP